MNARIKNPALLLPDAMPTLLALAKVTDNGRVPARTLELVHLRASQINGCSVCIDLHAKSSKKTDEPVERLLAVSAWREAPYFTDAERAALGLAEAVTRIADSADPVPDEVWSEAATHYDEGALATIVLHVAIVNVWNRVNVATRQIAGQVSW